MKLKLGYILEDSEVLEITKEMGYGFAIEEIDCVAPLFWYGEFMNDCFKRLSINDYSVEKAFITHARYFNPDLYNEYEEKEAYARAYILKALNEYAKANGITPNYILVDVSW